METFLSIYLVYFIIVSCVLFGLIVIEDMEILDTWLIFILAISVFPTLILVKTGQILHENSPRDLIDFKIEFKRKDT